VLHLAGTAVIQVGEEATQYLDRLATVAMEVGFTTVVVTVAIRLEDREATAASEEEKAGRETRTA